MDSNSWLLYVLLVALILGGGYFAGAEIAFASCNKIRLKTQAETGDPRSRTALYISEHFDNALTTLLIGNNITHIAAASVATLIATRLFGTSAEVTLWCTVISTLIVFLFSEMIPKSFANDRSETAALFAAKSLRFLMPYQAFAKSLRFYIRWAKRFFHIALQPRRLCGCAFRFFFPQRHVLHAQRISRFQTVLSPKRRIRPLFEL